MDATWLEPFLLRLGITSLHSLLLVGAILLIQRLWPRLPAATRATLWWLAALQLVLGLAWPRPLEVPLLPAPAAEVATASQAATASAATANVIAVDRNSSAQALRAAPMTVLAVNDPNPGNTASPAESTASAGLPWPQLLAWLWLTGVIMTALQSLYAYQQSRAWRRSAQRCVQPLVLAIYADVGAQLRLRALPPLHVSADIASPQLLGPWQPIVLLPQSALQDFDGEEIRMALHHELSHHQRRDLWWGWLPAIARHLFFFHPAAHLIVREYAFAREAACDEAVLASDHYAAHDYGRLLLRLGVAPRPCAGMAGASPTYTLLKRRLLMLQNSTAATRGLPLLLIAATVVVAALPWRVTAQAPAAAASAQTQATAKPRAQTVVVAQATPAPKPSATPKPAAAASVTPRPAPAPVAPVAPTAPKAPAEVDAYQGTVRISGSNDYAYVIMRGRDITASAESRDFKESRRLQAGSNEPMIYVRKGAKTYLIRDPATVQKAQALWKPVNDLGNAQGKLGEAQGKLGSEQGALGAKQGALGSQMGELGRQNAQLALRQVSLSRDDSAAAQKQRETLDRQSEALAARQEALGAQQEALGRAQEALGNKQSALGEQQSALGELQSAASDRADAQMKQLIDQAIANGQAKPAG